MHNTNALHILHRIEHMFSEHTHMCVYILVLKLNL